MPNRNKRYNPYQFVFPFNGRHLLIVPAEDKTNCLLYDRIEYNRDDTELFLKKLRPHLTPLLRSKEFIKRWSLNPRFQHPMCGACVPATQAVFYAYDTDKLEPFTAVDNEGMEHWWCRDKQGGKEIDATISQYVDNDLLPPYESGVVANWYGWKGAPQIRTLHLLNRVLPDTQLYVVKGDDYTPPGVLPV